MNSYNNDNNYEDLEELDDIDDIDDIDEDVIYEGDGLEMFEDISAGSDGDDTEL